jgi:3-hydroxyphenylacetate 6-hydroxylase
MIIPQGSTIFLNSWVCDMDPEVYHHLENFEPEHFIANPDLPIFTYSVGTQMCAGYILGNRELYIVFLQLSFEFLDFPRFEGRQGGV